MNIDELIYALMKEPLVDHVELSWVVIYATICVLSVLIFGYVISNKRREMKKAVWFFTIIFALFTAWLWYKLSFIIVC